MSRGTAPQRLIVMTESDTSCKYWYIVVGVTIPFKGPKRGLSKIMIYFSFDLGRKNEQKNISRGTAPQRLIVMIDIDTTCKYWYPVVGVTIPFTGPKRGLSKIMIYFTFDSCARKLNKILCLMVLPH